jgi:hypothetical protein
MNQADYNWRTVIHPTPAQITRKAKKRAEAEGLAAGWAEKEIKARQKILERIYSARPVG